MATTSKPQNQIIPTMQRNIVLGNT